MHSRIPQNRTGAVIRIAVQAAVGTGVVRADIDTGGAPARRTLVFIFSDRQPVSADPLQALQANTMGVPDPERGKVRRLGTGVQLQAVCFCRLRKPLHERNLLFTCFRLNLQRPCITDGFRVQVNKAHGTLFRIVPQPCGQRAEIADVILHRVFLAQKHRVVSPHHPLPSDRFGELPEGRNQDVVFRRQARLGILAVCV